MRSGRTISENFRSLFCLEENGYVSRGADDRFRLTMKMFTLAHRYPPSRRVIDAALPEMHALSEQVRQSCHLAVEEEGELLILAQVESPAEVGINVRVGTRRALVATASGRVIIAQGGPERRVAALTAAGVTPDSVAGRLALDRIERIAQLGFESVADDTLTGIVDLSRPIFDLNGACIAALTIPFLTATGRDNRLDETLELLSAATVADFGGVRSCGRSLRPCRNGASAMTQPVLRVAVRRFGPFESAIRKQFEAFRAATGVDAGIEPVAMDLEDLSHTMFDAGGLKDGSWDIGFVVTDWLPMAVEDGHLADLLARARESPAEGAPDCWPECLRGQQEIGGGLWGLPYHDGPECLVYRRDLFADGGRAPSPTAWAGRCAPPRTWDEFVEVARFFTRPETGQWGTIFAGYPDGHNTVYDFCLQLWSRGGDLIDAAGVPTLETPAAVAALDFYRRLVNDRAATSAGAGGDRLGQERRALRRGRDRDDGQLVRLRRRLRTARYCRSRARSTSPRCRPDPAARPSRSMSTGCSPSARAAVTATRRTRFIRHACGPAMDKLLTLEGGIGCRRSTWTDPEVAAMIPFAAEMNRLHAIARIMPADRRLPLLATIIDAAVAESLRTEDATETILERAQGKAGQLWRPT